MSYIINRISVESKSESSEEKQKLSTSQLHKNPKKVSPFNCTNIQDIIVNNSGIMINIQKNYKVPIAQTIRSNKNTKSQPFTDKSARKK